MNEYSISNYDIFNNATETADSLSKTLTTAKSEIESCSTQLKNESIFFGPVSDQATEGCEKALSKAEVLNNNSGIIKNYLQQTSTNYQLGDNEAEQEILSTSTDGKMILDGNVIDTTKPVTTGAKYNLSDDDLAFLGYVASSEQGSVDGAKLELSLMANLYEENKDHYSSVRDYVENSGWFGSSYGSEYNYPGDEYIDVTKDVLVNGNRYLNSNVVEHDYLGDIVSCSTGDVYDKSCYVPEETVLENQWGAKYVFVGFAPNDGDPFGYLVD